MTFYLLFAAVYVSGLTAAAAGLVAVARRRQASTTSRPASR
jgi:hypothetical protein